MIFSTKFHAVIDLSAKQISICHHYCSAANQRQFLHGGKVLLVRYGQPKSLIKFKLAINYPSVSCGSRPSRHQAPSHGSNWIHLPPIREGHCGMLAAGWDRGSWKWLVADCCATASAEELLPLMAGRQAGGQHTFPVATLACFLQISRSPCDLLDHLSSKR